MTKKSLEKIQALSAGFCNTPLVEVTFSYKGEIKKIYGKYEAFNFSGSIKDRVAFYILQKAYEKGAIKAGDTIVEATSGNTGIAFAALGRALGHKVRIYMPDWLSNERYQIMESLGVEIIRITKEQGGFVRSIEEARKYAATNPDVFCPEQFTNHENIVAHCKTTAVEIFSQLKSVGLKPDYFVAGVGTGGTVMGVLKYCQDHKVKCHCHPMEPLNSPTLTTGGKKIGKHRIQGISDEFIPDIVDLNALEEIVSVDDGDAIIMAQKMNRAGLSVGISSGGNFIAALKLILESKKDEVAVTIFCDSSMKYLSTDLCKKEPVKLDFLSTDVEIIEYKFIK
ncbi:MAG: cysteine synthase family protein [Proteobacteria bacterium]|nr:cysteine synthase family protein [Pseudomonadota bacterium]